MTCSLGLLHVASEGAVADGSLAVIVISVLGLGLAIAGFVLNARLRTRIGEADARHRELQRRLDQLHRFQQDSSNLLHLVTEGTPDSIYVKDLEGRFLFINPAGAAALGCPLDEILGSTAQEVVSPDSLREIERGDRRAIETGRPLTYEQTLEVGGESHIFLTTKGVYRDAGGEVAGTFGISRDITRRKLDEEERESLRNQELHGQKMNALGALAGGIAHDFNNLLTGVLGEVELLLMKSRDRVPEFTSSLRQIQEIAIRASELTRQLQSFSRKQQPTFKATDLNYVLQRAARLLRRALDPEVEVHVEVDQSLPRVRADAARLEHALLHLGLNAGDAIAGKGRIDIRIDTIGFGDHNVPRHPDARPGEFVRMRVEDDGPGIPAEHVDRIFEPFFSTKESDRQSGLGLAEVYGAVSAHDGWIAVSSEVGRGTRFELYVPLLGCDEIDDEALGVDLRDLPRGQETVIIADDTDTVLYLARDVLELCGYRVLTAWNGNEALEAFDRHHGEVDLILTDLVMPRTGGRALLRKIRERGWDGPVLLMSAHTIYRDSAEAIRDGFAGMLAKPFTPRALAEAIRNAVTGVPARRTPTQA